MKTWMNPTIKRENWGAGAWENEPDKMQWTNRTTGLECLIVRNRVGALCGYVGVPDTHPYHGKGYDDIEAQVHGGLTFAKACQEGPPEETICHVPEPGKPDNLWWFGFDCAHCGDFFPQSNHFAATMPNWPVSVRDRDEIYRTVDYVSRQCRSLAKQLAAVA